MSDRSDGKESCPSPAVSTTSTSSHDLSIPLELTSPNDIEDTTSVKSPGGGKVRRKSDSKICEVCGDHALGVNFDALCCESCKAFFRRNALKEKQTKCLFSGSCKIDVYTRRFCPHCRLQKCLKVGMKKTNILGEEERKKRMEKVLYNRQKRHKTKPMSDDPNSPSADSTTAVSLANLSDIAAAVMPQMATIMCVPVSTTTLQVDAANLSATMTDSPQSLVTVNTLEMPIVNMADAPLQQDTSPQVAPPQLGIPASMPPSLNAFISQSLAQQPYTPCSPQAVSADPLPETNNMLAFCKFASLAESADGTVDDIERLLTIEESKMIQELVDFYDLSFTVDLEPLIHIKQIDPSLNQLVNQSSITVLRIIKFSKRLDEFARLSQECQIGILKGTWIHILLLRSVSLYDSVRDVWVTPKGDIPTEILKNATGYVQLHDDHVNYCKSFKSLIGDDLTIIVILLVIMLFSPEGVHVVTRGVVANIQDKYLVLLKHYLESNYGYSRAAQIFPDLMAKLKELKELAEVHSKYLLDLNPSDVEPIMLEILDLK